MAYIIAIDEGTTSTRAILYDLTKNKIVAQKSSRIKQFYPQAGFVEENASEIYAETLASLVEILELCDDASEVKGIGITNQRETVVAWDKRTGKPLYNAIVWQCRRTAEFMNAIAKTHGDFIRKKTGLVCDAYFSASKMKWLLDNVPEIKAKSESGDLCFGTVDSFLAYKLTGGKAFVTDVTNASRTMLCNLGSASWDDDLLDLFGVDKRSLPKIVMSDARVGEFEYNGLKIPICGMAGDQQAALIGQGCLNAGDSKITYGTGLFMLYNTGYKSIISQNGLVTTIGYGIGGRIVYAFEGSVFNAGSAVQWLRDNLGFFRKSSDSESLAKEAESTDGVYVVPAFTGLGAPHWDAYARGAIVGLTCGVNKYHIIRATLDSLCYQVNDVLHAMEADSGIAMKALKVDGGACANNYLMQTMADISSLPVERPCCVETTALGAAYLAGLAVGYWQSTDEVVRNWSVDRTFLPDISAEERTRRIKGWNKAVRCAYHWALDEE
mgnify:CR=1 FL=1